MIMTYQTLWICFIHVHWVVYMQVRGV